RPSGDHRGALNCVPASATSDSMVARSVILPEKGGSGFSRTKTRSRCPGRSWTATSVRSSGDRSGSSSRASFVSRRERPLVRERTRSEEHTSELQSLAYLVCRLLLEKKKKN